MCLFIYNECFNQLNLKLFISWHTYKMIISGVTGEKGIGIWGQIE